MGHPLISKRIILGLLLLLALASCEPEATPVVFVPTETPVPTLAPTEVPTWRYGVLLEILPHIAANLPDNIQIVEITDAQQLDFATLDSSLDVVIALGDAPGWTPLPQHLRLTVALNADLPPLDDPKISDLLRRAFDPQVLAQSLTWPGTSIADNQSLPSDEIRTRLANLGYPDGFELLVSANNSGIEPVITMLEQANFHARLTTSLFTREARSSDGYPAHLTFLFTLAQPNEEAPPQSFELYRIPLSYISPSNLTVELSPAGLPLPAES